LLLPVAVACSPSPTAMPGAGGSQGGWGVVAVCLAQAWWHVICCVYVHAHGTWYMIHGTWHMVHAHANANANANMNMPSKQ
jgi:hypothetical protein